MTKDDILEGVIACVAQSLALEVEELKPGSLLITDLDADSLDVMDIMFQMEEKFGIKLQKEDFNFFKRLGLSEEEGLNKDGLLTSEALERLKKWLPSLDTSAQLKPVDLGKYLSIESLFLMVEATLEAASGT